MAKVNLNGFEMNVEVHEGLVPMDTVFLHGNLASNRWWHPALEVWKKNAKPGNEGRLIFAEWRGCGGSAHPENESELLMDNMAKDYVNLVRQMGIKKANLVGHSTGCLIALFALVQAPELFNRVVLLDAVAANGIQFGDEMYGAFTQMSQDRNMCAAILGATIHGNDPANPFFQKLVDDAFSIGKKNWHGIPNALKVANVTEGLSKITQPMLVLHGEHDNLLPKPDAQLIAKTVQNGRYYEIPGHGHCTNVEDPALFVKLTNEFLFA